MDDRSEKILAHVHPDLAHILRATAQTPQPFVVILGKRAITAEQAAVASGHSTTLHSRHLPDHKYATPADPDGVSCAVDVAALVAGSVSFAPGHERAVFGQIAAQVMAACDALGVPPERRPEWGGADVGAWAPGVVSHFHDWDHFQLPWQTYP